MYIAKYLAACGVCSRRNAIEIVKSGQISVNGKIVNDVTYTVQPDDKVKYKNRLVKPENYKYILLNKPLDYITTLSDEKGRKTVIDLIKSKKNLERLYPVGRLDRMTTGLLILTNDGQLAQKLAHPKSGIIKGYQVLLDKPFLNSDLIKLKKGLILKDGSIKPDFVYHSSSGSKKKVTVKLHSGKKRIVRRMFEHLGYHVLKLDRFLYAGLSKKGLPVSRWRFLRKEEVEKLKKS